MIPTLSHHAIDQLIEIGPVTCGLIAFVTLCVAFHIRKKETSLYSLIVAAIAASAIPAAFLLIYSAYDTSAIPKLKDAKSYIAFAGAALLYISCRTIKEKW